MMETELRVGTGTGRVEEKKKPVLQKGKWERWLGVCARGLGRAKTSHL